METMDENQDQRGFVDAVACVSGWHDRWDPGMHTETSWVCSEFAVGAYEMIFIYIHDEW